MATADDCQGLGGLMRREARRLEQPKAQVKYAVSDGAEWIANQCRQQLPMLDAHILDYYHLQDSVRKTRYALCGGTAVAPSMRPCSLCGSMWASTGPLRITRRSAS